MTRHFKTGVGARPLAAAAPLAGALLCAVLAAPASASPWVDTVYSYSPGTLQESPQGSGNYFSDSSKALGPFDSGATFQVPTTDVVQLGQAGNIVLAFSQPILNNRAAPATNNPSGYDFTIFGNAFQSGSSYYREPGFVEVAQKDGQGLPGTFYLVLPDDGKWPSQLVGGTDSGQGTQLYNGYADVHPTDGTGDPLLPPDVSGNAGGDSFLLERAVLESSPGIPLLDHDGNPQFVALESIDFIRITDAIANDSSPITGAYTTDVDAAVDLPGTVPEPAAIVGIAIVAAGMALRRRTGAR